MTKAQFEATRGSGGYSDDDVVAGLAPYKVGDTLSFLHNSEENAYLIKDYPYGRQLRTLMRVWYEHDKKKGTRLATQTLNPKNAIWNKPHKSTYSRARVEVFDAEGHLQPQAWGEYSADKAQEFLDKFREDVPPWVVEELVYAAAYFVSMNAAKAANPSLEYGTPEHKEATKAAIKALVDGGYVKKKEQP